MNMPPNEHLSIWHLGVAIRAHVGVSEAIERHRRLGESIVIWRDGQIVTLTGDEIPPQNIKSGNETKTNSD